MGCMPVATTTPSSRTGHSKFERKRIGVTEYFSFITSLRWLTLLRQTKV